MRIKAVLYNADHPEYGLVTVPFPIPQDQYDDAIKMLEAVDIGDPRARDCTVEEIEGSVPSLKCLEGHKINVDELDYLVKRLDSFADNDLAQFQGMAVKMGLSDMTDLINLTFSCQHATVITDFSDLEQVGREHYMNLHGGCASMEELEQLDGLEIALLLITESEGTITPYGVVYDNDRKSLLCRTKRYRSKMGLRSQAFQQFYGDFHGKIFYVAKLALFPVNGVKTKPPLCFSQDICNYTETGRKKIHALQNAVNPHVLRQLMENPIQGASTELNDNRISMFVAQHGKCAISKEPLTLGNIVVHHITPKQTGGGDNYENLILVTPDVHQLIHATEEESLRKYLDRLKSCKLNMPRLNKLRELAGNCKIVNR